MRVSSSPARGISTFLRDVFLPDSAAPVADAATADEHYTVADIMALLHDRGYALMVILLGLPIAIPGNPPPIPSIFALPLCLLCVQMMMGYDAPRLPAMIARKRVKKRGLQRIVSKALPYIEKIEFFTKPRLVHMTGARSERLIGGCMLLFGLCVMIPLPLTNTVPGIAMIIMSVGLLSRDGLLVIGGAVLGTCWIVGLVLFSATAVELVQGWLA